MHQALQRYVQLVCIEHAGQVKVMLLLTWTCSCLMQASILQKHDQGLCHLCGCRNQYHTQRAEQSDDSGDLMLQTTMVYEATSRLRRSMQPNVHPNAHPVQHTVSAILYSKQREGYTFMPTNSLLQMGCMTDCL